MVIKTDEKITTNIKLKQLSFGDETREKWIEKILNRISTGKRILDAGAGQLKNKKFCQHLNYVSQDFCQYDGSGNGVGIQKGSWDTKQIDIVSDITEIPEKSASFDAVLCIAVIEHIPSPDKALQEFYRLLKQDGQLILSAPFASTTHFAPYHFYSGFTRYFYEEKLKKSGFINYEIEPNGNFFDFIQAVLHNLPEFIKIFSTYDLKLNDLTNIHHLSEILSEASIKSKNAEELLNFGYNVIAYK